MADEKQEKRRKRGFREREAGTGPTSKTGEGRKQNEKIGRR
jgi:hypothetical protein